MQKPPVAIAGFPDNIGVDASGMLWVTGRFNGMTPKRHFGGADYPVPGRFYRIAPDATGPGLMAADSGRHPPPAAGRP